MISSLTPSVRCFPHRIINCHRIVKCLFFCFWFLFFHYHYKFPVLRLSSASLTQGDVSGSGTFPTVSPRSPTSASCSRRQPPICEENRDAASALHQLTFCSWKLHKRADCALTAGFYYPPLHLAWRIFTPSSISAGDIKLQSLWPPG